MQIGEPIDVVANYSETVFGTWHVTVFADGQPAGAADGANIHDVFDEALDIVERIAIENHQPCATVHTLWGDPEAFAVLAEQQGPGAWADD